MGHSRNVVDGEPRSDRGARGRAAAAGGFGRCTRRRTGTHGARVLSAWDQASDGSEIASDCSLPCETICRPQSCKAGRVAEIHP